MKRFDGIRKWWLTAGLAITATVGAQWREPFDSIAALDHWTGDTAAFTVAGGMLRLDDDTPTRSVSIWRAVSLPDTIEWQITVRMPFAPSHQNRARIYLFADTPHADSARGYYLQLGESGAADGIDLYRQHGPAAIRIVKGRDSTIADGVDHRIIVRYFHPGRWVVYSIADSTALEGIGHDTFTLRTGFFGIHCRHTSTRRRAFYFDDIYTGPQVQDTIAPRLASVAVIDALRLRIRFDEAIVPGLPTDTDRFALRPGHPIDSVAWTDSGAVLLWQSPLAARRPYMLYTYRIADTAGNLRAADSLRFLYYVPRFGDVVFNEIMADPEPPQGLPPVEYVELYNTTPWDLSMAGWALSDPTRTARLPAVTLPAGGYLIVTSAADSFSGSAVSPPSMPTLNNSGDSLRLHAPNGTLVDALFYRNDWHLPSRRQGGWALERIAPAIPCQGPENWTSSADPSGGTPGRRNSVYNPLHDTLPPHITAAEFDADQRLRVDFAERVFPDSPSLDGMPALPPWADSLSADQRTLWFEFQGRILGNTPYRIVLTGIRDCWGNSDTLRFTVLRPAPEPAPPFAVRITELMVDPDPPIRLPPTEYVELFNASADTVQLWDWTLSDGGRTARIPPYRLAPGGYVVLTAASDTPSWRGVAPTIGLEGFPSLNNGGDSLWLRDPLGAIIDFVAYSDEWHQWNVLKAEGGWAYELRDAGIRCRTADNWGFSDDLLGGTPGRANSIGGFTDTVPPFLRHFAMPDAEHLFLRFSEPLDPDHLTDPTAYLLEGGQTPSALHADSTQYDAVLIRLPFAADSGATYRLHLQGLADCAGRAVVPDTFRFGIPRPAGAGHMVISELLVQPDAEGAEFIEIHNTTPDLLDVWGLWLVRYGPDSSVAHALPLPSGTMPPGAYWVITKAPDMVARRYFTPRPEWMHRADLFSLPDDSARLAVVTPALDVIDAVRYDVARLRPPYLSDPRGVSIERLSGRQSGLDLSNWRYAATTVQATPTGPNSQALPDSPAGPLGDVQLAYYTLTPDGDGVRDLLRIHYHLPEGGYHAILSIFDRLGRTVFHQVQPDLIGPQGTLEWMPRTTDHRPLPPGTYLGMWEYYHPTSGRKGIFRFSFSIVYP